MLAKNISVIGLRGFSENKTINLAQPNGKIGSGLTTIVGGNNSGKSTIFECFQLLSSNKEPGISESKRNKIVSEKIEVILTYGDGSNLKLSNSPLHGSNTIFEGTKNNNIFMVPSRRHFSHEFSKNEYDRDTMLRSMSFPPSRGQGIGHFSYRLFHAEKNKSDFDKILVSLLGKEIDWKIDMKENGQYYLKIQGDKSNSHNSEGLGEGILSLFTIADILYESKENDIIYIDEPELSIHPALQKRLISVLAEYAKDRQIIINTHSPYFIDWHSILEGGEIVRCLKIDEKIEVYQLSAEARSGINGLINDTHFPHALGNDAKEVFFMEDSIILLEGQEDIIYYQKIEEELQIKIQGNYFGWGVGGAGKMTTFCTILKDLGYKKVFGILDKDKESVCEELKQKFSNNGFNFCIIPTDDIRYKPAVKEKPEKEGIIKNGTLLEQYKEDLKEIFEKVNDYFK